jgi:hypothetical protein
VIQHVSDVLGAGRTDAAGGYRVTVPRATPDHSRWIAYVWAPGHALRAVPATADPALLDVHDLKSVRLERGRTVRVRVVDRAGAPVAGLTLDVAGLILIGTIFHTGGRPPAQVPGWPEPRVTAADGTFAIDDLMPGTRVALDVRDVRFAADRLGFVVPAGSDLVPDLKVSPPRMLAGRVTAADTGRPLADAVVAVQAVGSVSFGIPGHLAARTDAAGMYTLPTQSAGYQWVTVTPPVDTGYPAYQVPVDWPAGADRVTTDLAVPPGIVIRGRVVEAGTDRPVPGAAVTYEWAMHNNPFARDLLANNVALRTWRTQSGPDGSFAVAVRPGPGHLLVKAPTLDFVHAEVSWRELRGESPGGRTHFPDAVVPLRPVPGGPPPDVTVQLRRGVTVRARVVGADGKPAADGVVVAPHVIPRGIDRIAVPLRLQNGRFEVSGCPPGGSVTVWVHDFPSKSAAVVTLPVDGTEPTVRLAPTVAARFRVVDAAGKVFVGRLHVLFDLEIRPGLDEGEAMGNGGRAVEKLQASLIYGDSYGPIVERNGTLRLPDLIPGATYLVSLHEPRTTPPKIRFTAPMTGTTDLPPLTVIPKE